ncbi:MAG: aconitate hydratase, partial [Rhodococcus erythropolis]|nr:aconitate hydratase [Rhodococcus erythropolis]
RGAVFEFHGPGVSTLTTSGRATISNMIIETGATTAVFPSDDETEKWLVEQGRREDYTPLEADPGATYAEDITIDLTALNPLVAVPHSPGNVLEVAEVPDTPLSQVCVGSSVNSSYDDLATVAGALRGKTVHPRIQLTVTPGSRQILTTIIESGVYRDLMDAGARILEPICGPCVGIGQAPLQGAPSLRTFNRNFPGRSGTAEDQVYLCSPSTAAASALTGRITDPSRRDPIHPRPAVTPDTTVHDRHITAPLPLAERSSTLVQRGSNLISPQLPPPVPDDLSMRVLITVGDDVSTGDMAPDGAIAMSVWSNIALCARFMFNRFDTGFHDRALEWGGGIIVAGDNYGQGSSREHAALIPVYLGVRAIAARSYARIHRRNLRGQHCSPANQQSSHIPMTPTSRSPSTSPTAKGQFYWPADYLRTYGKVAEPHYLSRYRYDTTAHRRIKGHDGQLPPTRRYPGTRTRQLHRRPDRRTDARRLRSRGHQSRAPWNR